MPTTLIEPAALSAHLADPDWAIVDCRFELARPAWGALAWAAGHIPNALYGHLDRDLSGPRTALTGRHPLPAIAALSATFGRWGIEDRKSTRLNSSHSQISYAVFCLKKK